MRGLNRWTGLGNLGRDPEVKEVAGSKVASFSIAINESYKDKQGQLVEKTEWINVVAWRKTAELAERFLKKGSKVLIEGKMQTRTWDKDGETRYSTEIVANSFIMLDAKGAGPDGEIPDLPF